MHTSCTFLVSTLSQLPLGKFPGDWFAIPIRQNIYPSIPDPIIVCADNIDSLSEEATSILLARFGAIRKFSGTLDRIIRYCLDFHGLPLD